MDARNEASALAKETHLVLDGRVFCARQGRDVDLERCLRCGRLAAFELDTKHPWVQCEEALPGPLARAVSLEVDRRS